MEDEDIKFEFEFEFGKKKRSIFDYVKLGVFLNGTIDLLAMVPFLDRRKAFNFIDVIQLTRNYDFLNEYIISDPEFLGYRIDRKLDAALKKYKREINED